MQLIAEKFVLAAQSAENRKLWANRLRHLDQDDIEIMRWHLLRLNTTDRRARFGNAVSDRFIEDYVTRIDLSNTQIIGCFVDGLMRGVAELRSIEPTWHRQAEAAFSVEQAWQGQGIGTALMTSLIEAARARDLQVIYACFDSRNVRMEALMRSFKARIDRTDNECLAELKLA